MNWNKWFTIVVILLVFMLLLVAVVVVVGSGSGGGGVDLIWELCNYLVEKVRNGVFPPIVLKIMVSILLMIIVIRIIIIASPSLPHLGTKDINTLFNNRPPFALGPDPHLPARAVNVSDNHDDYYHGNDHHRDNQYYEWWSWLLLSW